MTEDIHTVHLGARNPDLGFVGDVEAVNPAILHRLLAEELIPVVSTIGTKGTSLPRLYEATYSKPASRRLPCAA